MHRSRANCVRARHIGEPKDAQRQHRHGATASGESVSESISRVVQCSTATTRLNSKNKHLGRSAIEVVPLGDYNFR